MATRVASSSTTKQTQDGGHSTRASTPASGGYVLPVLHTRIPDKTVHLGFWGGLIGAVAFGAVDVPLAAIVGVGVLVARHRRSH